MVSVVFMVTVVPMVPIVSVVALDTTATAQNQLIS